MDWQEESQEPRKLSWVVRALLFGAPIAIVGALLFQVGQIKEVDQSPIDARPKPSPAMEAVMSASLASVSGRRELQDAMVGSDFNVGLRAAMRLVGQGNEGWIAVTERLDEVPKDLQLELAERRLPAFVGAHGAAAILSDHSRAREATYRVLEAEAKDARPRFPWEYEDLGLALIQRLTHADNKETARIEALLAKFFPDDAAAQFIGHKNRAVQLLALKRYGYTASSADIPRLERSKVGADPTVVAAIDEAIHNIGVFEKRRAQPELGPY